MPNVISNVLTTETKQRRTNMASSFDSLIARLEATVKRQEAALIQSKAQLAEAKQIAKNTNEAAVVKK